MILFDLGLPSRVRMTLKETRGFLYKLPHSNYYDGALAAQAAFFPRQRNGKKKKSRYNSNRFDPT